MNILIIDDEKEICDTLSHFIKIIGKYNIKTLYDSRQAINIAENEKIDLIITDVRMPYISGIEIAEKIIEKKLPVEIILISGQNDIIKSINALDIGIYDFITKPVNLEKVAKLIHQLEHRKQDQNNFDDLLNKEIINPDKIKFPKDLAIYNKHIGIIISASHFMKNIIKKIKKISKFPDIPVLIEGDTGTGKEVIAKLLHYHDEENEEPFIGINCASLDKNLFEAELFGYEKGAFTGANPTGKIGKIQLAKGGTLFLDEVTEISLDLQTKLLRVFQEKEYYKVGGNTIQKVNTRIVCATNKNILKLVENGFFRNDLYFRLDVCKITIPPLSERKEEIIPLALLFIKEVCIKNSIPIKEIEGKTLQYLLTYPWTGNIRQLKNTILKVILFSEGSRITIKDFDFLSEENKDTIGTINPKRFILPADSFSLEQYVDDIILKTLHQFNGNKSKTAEFLGIDRFKFYHRYKKIVNKYEKEINND